MPEFADGQDDGGRDERTDEGHELQRKREERQQNGVRDVEQSEGDAVGDEGARALQHERAHVIEDEGVRVREQGDADRFALAEQRRVAFSAVEQCDEGVANAAAVAQEEEGENGDQDEIAGIADGGVQFGGHAVFRQHGEDGAVVIGEQAAHGNAAEVPGFEVLLELRAGDLGEELVAFTYELRMDDNAGGSDGDEKDHEGEERGQGARPVEESPLVELDQRTEQVGEQDGDDEDQESVADEEEAGDQEQNEDGRPGAARGRSVNAQHGITPALGFWRGPGWRRWGSVAWGGCGGQGLKRRAGKEAGGGVDPSGSR